MPIKKGSVIIDVSGDSESECIVYAGGEVKLPEVTISEKDFKELVSEVAKASKYLSDRQK